MTTVGPTRVLDVCETDTQVKVRQDKGMSLQAVSRYRSVPTHIPGLLSCVATLRSSCANCGVTDLSCPYTHDGGVRNCHFVLTVLVRAGRESIPGIISLHLSHTIRCRTGHSACVIFVIISTTGELKAS
ncbi:hypothetical protein J6590_102514 [Homalodisca vitripennis]|nr:hypothetical protein J6590_003026 [Homalodisca vitripennis]KAG8333828.1 hypothetical protein J6590_102514 [Homalodisca vitripennis]